MNPNDITIDVVTFTQEGFTSGLGFRFPNGLVLKTYGHDLLWGGVEEREKVKAQFKQTITLLKDAGFNLQDGE